MDCSSRPTNSQRGKTMELIGFIGLGTIGSVIAAHLRKAGYQMVVHDIRPEALDPLVKVGAQLATSPAETAQNCRVVFSSLPGPAEVEKVALGSNGLLHGVHDGSIYIDLSSSSPELICRVESEFQRVGACVMDAPLIVGKLGIANKNVQILASGSVDTYHEVKPLLDAFGDTVVYTGALGSGTVIKLAHNLVRRGIGLAIGEGIVLGTKPELTRGCFGIACDGVWMFNSIRWENLFRKQFSRATMTPRLVSASA